MPHLTEDQIDELLMGSLEPGEAARFREHAAICESCTAQLAQLEAPIANFKAVSLAWSERRSATMPVRPAGAQRSGARWGMGFAWGAVAAAALLAAVIPVLRHEQNVRMQEAYNKVKMQAQPVVMAPASTVPPANSESEQNVDTAVQENAQEIAKDNQLLAMVDAELNAPIPTPGSTTQGRGHTRTNLQGTLQD
jgi:anti-sigma factor RsiW